jgi:hypothetical protein
MKKFKFSIAVMVGMIPIGVLEHLIWHSSMKDNDLFFVLMLVLVVRFISVPIISFILNKI